MASKVDKITIKNKKHDRRVKLTEEDREEIKKLKGSVTQQEAANRFGVSRRTIQFIWNPEQLEENKKRRKERGGSKVYYDRRKHRDAMRDHRRYKKQLLEKGVLKIEEKPNGNED